ncbi:hypothetical protein ABZY05_46185 [Streptomyces canus]
MSSYRRDLVSRAIRNEFRSLATDMTADELAHDDTSGRRVTIAPMR